MYHTHTWSHSSLHSLVLVILPCSPLLITPALAMMATVVTTPLATICAHAGRLWADLMVCAKFNTHLFACPQLSLSCLWLYHKAPIFYCIHPSPHEGCQAITYSFPPSCWPARWCTMITLQPLALTWLTFFCWWESQLCHPLWSPPPAVVLVPPIEWMVLYVCNRSVFFSYLISD